jgi:hypothetical protein
MFDKEINFSCHEDYFNLKQDYPTPIKLNIPEWYKKLQHTLDRKTVKGCMPFLDTLTSGYLLKIPQDFRIIHNVSKINKHNLEVKDSFQESPNFGFDEFQRKYINLNHKTEYHSVYQLEGSPLLEKNKNQPIHKLTNPWFIKTPPGYSCLFVSPLNNSDDRFSIIPGIVDTDVYTREINFPIIVNGDKYPVLDSVIKKGTPYVQIIPFKRDNWKMTVEPLKQKKIENTSLFYALRLIDIYKNEFWKKKSWK